MHESPDRPVLARRQNHWESSGDEREHDAQVHPSAGRAGTYRHQVQWAAQRKSAVPPRPIQEMIDESYARQLEQLELAAERQRIAKLIQEWEAPA